MCASHRRSLASSLSILLPGTVIAMTIDQFIYGPFLDEELFFYDDTRTVIELDAVQIFDMDQGFVGFDDLERIHDQGRDGSYDRVMFSGVATLKKVSVRSVLFGFICLLTMFLI